MLSSQVVRRSTLFLSLILLALACKSARYEFVKEDDRVVASPEENQNPKDFGPGGDEGESGNPTPTPPPNTDDGRPNLPPSADVEVIDEGQPTTKIKVGRNVVIRPTLDTADADDVGVSSCVNPGIVKVVYDFEGGPKTAERTNGCESLNIEHRFDQPGDYRIKMTVSTDEGETAVAEMILTVIPEDAPEADTDGGFEISADPIIAGKGQKIVFTGRCDATTKTTITWDFKDGGKASGKQVTHRYENTGQYEVEGTCTDANGKTKIAKITIVVIDTPLFPDGIEDPNLNDDDEPDTGGAEPTPTPAPDTKDDDDQPGQVPRQNSGCQSHTYTWQNRTCGYR